MSTNAIITTSIFTTVTYLLYKRATTFPKNKLDHVVLLKLRDDPLQNNHQQLTNAIASLTTIPGVQDISVGQTYTTQRSSGYTHALVARLDNKSALTAYATHTEHLIVKAKIIAAIQPLLTTQENEIGTIIVPPVLALDYHSKRYKGTVPTKDIEDSLAVTHVVLICLRPNCNSKCASCRNLDQQLKQAAKEMAQGIPGIIDLTFGRTFTTNRACGYTHCLNVRFLNKKSGDQYQPHTLHAKFKSYLYGNFSRTISNNLPKVLCLDWVGKRE